MRSDMDRFGCPDGRDREAGGDRIVSGLAARNGWLVLHHRFVIDGTARQETDAIVVSDEALFVIETKYWRGRVEPHSDGGWLHTTVGGFAIRSRSGIEQVDSAADRLSGHLFRSDARLASLPVFGLVCMTAPDCEFQALKRYGGDQVVAPDALEAAMTRRRAPYPKCSLRRTAERILADLQSWDEIRTAGVRLTGTLIDRELETVDGPLHLPRHAVLEIGGKFGAPLEAALRVGSRLLAHARLLAEAIRFRFPNGKICDMRLAPGMRLAVG